MKRRKEERQGVPPRKRDVLFVQSPGAGEKVRLLVYTPQFWGCFTHYTANGTVPCYENHDLCEGGHKILNSRWKGYLHCWSYSRNEQVIAQFTLEAANQLMDQLAEGALLRGMMIETARTAKKKGRQSCQLVTQYSAPPAHQLPPHIDPLRSLYNLWRRPYRDEPLTRHLSGDPPEEGQVFKIA